jgi:hypothetical protein
MTEPASPSRFVACTLFTGHYHFGAGALANSLYQRGFRGTIYMGFQRPLPAWAQGASEADGMATLAAASGLIVKFLPWASTRNLSLEKPRFLLHVLDRVAPEAAGVLFFDADVVVKASWTFFEDWLARGVALCLDASYPIVPANHPWRHAWRNLAATESTIHRDLEYYVNSGFVGLPRPHREVARCWAALIDRFLERRKIVDNVKFDTRENAFVGDQDMLNAALMATSAPLSIIGRDGMDFAPGGFVMSHAIEEPKPWQRHFIASAFSGRPPSPAEKNYWRYVESPIKLFPPGRVVATRASLRVASSIGRFYSRSP